jgi:hypothetical protein
LNSEHNENCVLLVKEFNFMLVCTADLWDSHQVPLQVTKWPIGTFLIIKEPKATNSCTYCVNRKKKQQDKLMVKLHGVHFSFNRTGCKCNCCPNHTSIVSSQVQEVALNKYKTATGIQLALQSTSMQFQFKTIKKQHQV